MVNYFKIHALSNSTMFGAFKAGVKKPAFLHLGSAVDAACTQPEFFDATTRSYYNESEESWHELSESDFHKTIMMRNEYLRNPQFKGIREKMETQAYRVFWFDPVTHEISDTGRSGMYRMKCKPDFIYKSYGADLKTSSCNNIDEFLSVVGKYNYDSAMYLYMNAFNLTDFAFCVLYKKRAGSDLIKLNINSPEYASGYKKICNFNFAIFPEYSFEAINATL